MREFGRDPCENVRHGGELFWRSTAVLQRPWGVGPSRGGELGGSWEGGGEEAKAGGGGKEGWIVM